MQVASTVRKGVNMSVDAQYLCSLGLAWLPPDSRYWSIEPDLHLALSKRIAGDIPARDEISRAYYELLSEGNTYSNSKAPVQSLYEPWTLDEQCQMTFAGLKGLRRGDAALHMDHVLASLELAVPEDIGLDSDHIATILSAASAIAEDYPEQIESFAADHLAWLDDYESETETAWNTASHATFYRALLSETIHTAKTI